MKWTLVDSLGQDIVLENLAAGRDVFVLKKLHDCRCGLTQTSIFQPSLPTPHAFRHPELPRALFCPARGQFDNPEDS